MSRVVSKAIVIFDLVTSFPRLITILQKRVNNKQWQEIKLNETLSFGNSSKFTTNVPIGFGERGVKLIAH